MYTLNIDWLAINWYSFTSQQTRIYSRWKDFFVKIVDNKLYFIFSFFSSLGHATLHLDPSVCQSVSILNYERVSHYCSCPSHCDWIAMYPVFFLVSFCQIHFSFFLVACYATLHPALKVRPSIGQLVRPSVHHTLLFLVFAVFGLTAPAQIIKWPQIQPLPTSMGLG